MSEDSQPQVRIFVNPCMSSELSRYLSCYVNFLEPLTIPSWDPMISSVFLSIRLFDGMEKNLYSTFNLLDPLLNDLKIFLEPNNILLLLSLYYFPHFTRVGNLTFDVRSTGLNLKVDNGSTTYQVLIKSSTLG